MDITTFDDNTPPPGESPWVQGESGPLRPVVAADPTWPRTFSDLERRIRSALGWRAVFVEHVGSTAVPLLPAQPIIDIDLIVADPAREEDYVSALERAGFELWVREPWWWEHRMLHLEDPACHLHVFGIDSPEPIRHRIFRDWLRGSPQDRNRYAQAKLAASQGSEAAGESVMEYNARKERVVREIYGRALREMGFR